MLSRIIGVMFKVNQLFTKNYPLFLHITLFLFDFNSFEIIRFQSLKVSKSYQNNQATSIKKLIGFPNSSFSLYYEMTQSDL